MTEFSIHGFLDLHTEVVHGEDEEEEEEEEELADFLNDDIEESEMDWQWPRSLTLSDLNDEATNLRASAAARRAAQVPLHEVLEDLPQHFLLPAQGDPELWAVHVKHGHKEALIFQLARCCIPMDDGRSPQPAITSAFSRPGILGVIFIEGRPCDVADAVRRLVTVYRQRQLVPPEECSRLLTFQDPLYWEFCNGEWVRCHHGLYRDDIGLVCEHDNSSEAELIVAFILRIPEHSGSTQKRKWPGRPEPGKWSADRAKAVWGDKVWKISDEEYELKDETYKLGLVLKHFPPASIVASSLPSDIGPFIRAPYISTLHFCSPMRLQYAQDTIKVGYRVKVIKGEQQGLVSHTIDISDGTANVIPQTDDSAPPIYILLHALTLLYVPGNHVKYRCSDTQGIVSVVRKDDRALTFVKQDTHEEILAYMDDLELWSPSTNYYQFKPGLWFNFSGPIDSKQLKRCRCITSVEDGHVIMVDERTFGEFEIDTQELEVAASQGPSLPAADMVHPWLGKRVIVVQGLCRGYHGIVRDIGNTSITIKLDTLFAGTVLPHQQFALHHLRPAEPPQALTPEPEGGHWIFQSAIKYVIEWRTLPFSFHNIHKASKELQDYARCTGRTVLMGCHTVTPKDGEVILSVFKRPRSKQVSIHPKFLAPWEPVRDGEVIVLNGPLFGTIGRVKERREDGQWVVRFAIDNLQADYVFEGKDLTTVE